MAVKARTEMELIGAEESARRLDQVRVAELNLERALLSGKITREQYAASTDKLNKGQQLLAVQLNTTKRQLDLAGEATRKITIEQNNAGRASNLITRMFGVEVPRAMDVWLNKSKLIGPTLSAGFGVISGFFAAGILLSLAKDIGQVIDKLYDWHGANKFVMESTVRMNQAIVEQEKRIASLQKQMELVGLSGSARVGKQRQQLLKDLAETEAEYQKIFAQVTPRLMFVGSGGVPTTGDIEAGIAGSAGQKKLQGLIEQLAVLRATSRALRAEIDLLGKEFSDALGNEATTAAEKAKRELQGLQRAIAQFTAASGRVRQDVRFQRVIDQVFGPAPAGAPDVGHPDFLSAGPGAVFEKIFRDANLEGLKRGGDEYRKAMQEQFQQIAERHAQMVRDMAGHLRAFAENPVEYIKERFKQMFFELLANWLLTTRAMGGALTGARPGAGGFFGSLFGGLFGGGGGGIFGGGLSSGIPGMPGTTPPFFPSGTAGGSASPLGIGANMGALAGDAGSLVGGIGGTLSGGGGFGLGGVLPAGATAGRAALTRGAAFRAALPGLAATGSLMLASLIGFSGPGRGAASGALTAGALSFALGLGFAGFGIGALIGAIIGIFSRGRKRKQRDEIERQAFRAIDQVKNAYNLHQLDFNSAIGQLEQIREQVNQAMRQLKWPSRMDPHIDRAIREINATEQERQRRGGIISGLPVPEFASGGFVPGSSRQAVPILAHPGEAVLNYRQQQMVGPERIRQAFSATAASSSARRGSFASGGMVSSTGEAPSHIEIHNHINCVDARGIEALLVRHSDVFVRWARRELRDRGIHPSF